MNVSDLLRASTNIACTSATDEYNAYNDELRETCGSYLTNFNEELGDVFYWTMNAFFDKSFNARVARADDSSLAWSVYFNQGIGGFAAAIAYNDRNSGARPVAYLKPSIQITGGDGTKENPYLLSN